ncbi:YdeI/OmpD-associated family protein [Owenweeksia hongkongensis]|uniref:YdeI/OmpD-associated family protein n=1 Tax=Owenweeksia hongkongensis TaxID=253245 RepID=UPI003A90223B
MKDPQYITPSSSQEWRDWLAANHQREECIWVIFYKVSSGVPSLTWSEAVDEALCFGWIDSTKRTIDKEKYKQYFSKRKAKSNWSKINKDKIEKLIAENRMMEAGLQSVEVAKQNGSWTILDEVEALIMPKDLEAELKTRPDAKDYFEGLSKSGKKILLHWVMSAKRPETRHKRIIEIAENAALGMKPKPFR